MRIENQLARAFLLGALLGPVPFVFGASLGELFIRFGAIAVMGAFFACLLVAAFGLEIRQRVRSKKKAEQEADREAA